MNLFEHLNDNDADQDDPISTDFGEEKGSPLTRLFRSYYWPLTRRIQRKFGNGPPAPEDIAQQTFAKMHELGPLSSIKDLKAYAWITAVNFVRADLRAQKVRSAYAFEKTHTDQTLECDTFDPERILRSRQALEIIAQTLKGMSERRRAIFMACRFEGLTPEQAGKREGVSRSSAVRHIAVATEMLAEALEANSAGEKDGDTNA